MCKITWQRRLAPCTLRVAMQKELQDKYKDKWEPISSETGKNKLLWMIS